MIGTGVNAVVFLSGQFAHHAQILTCSLSDSVADVQPDQQGMIFRPHTSGCVREMNHIPVENACDLPGYFSRI